MRGKIIAIEGTDSTGKKTQARELAKRLEAAGVPVETFAFPSYGTPFGELPADYLRGRFGSLKDVPMESAALLYAADRYQYKRGFEDKLARGVWLVIDRYTSSNYGHQAGKLAEAKQRKEFVDWLKAVESRLPPADCIVFLDLPVAVSLELKAKRGDKHAGTDLHEDDTGHLEDSRRAYLEVAERDGWLVVDCLEAGALRGIDSIAGEIWARLKANNLIPPSPE